MAAIYDDKIIHGYINISSRRNVFNILSTKEVGQSIKTKKIKVRRAAWASMKY